MLGAVKLCVCTVAVLCCSMVQARRQARRHARHSIYRHTVLVFANTVVSDQGATQAHCELFVERGIYSPPTGSLTALAYQILHIKLHADKLEPLHVPVMQALIVSVVATVLHLQLHAAGGVATRTHVELDCPAHIRLGRADRDRECDCILANKARIGDVLDDAVVDDIHDFQADVACRSAAINVRIHANVRETSVVARDRESFLSLACTTKGFNAVVCLHCGLEARRERAQKMQWSHITTSYTVTAAAHAPSFQHMYASIS